MRNIAAKKLHLRSKTRSVALWGAVLSISAIHIATAASLLEWNTVGNLGTETTEPSTLNAVNISGTNLTLGAGVSPAANTNRFGGSNWYDTGDASPPTLANSLSGNDYIQFIVTPASGYSFSATGFHFIWDHSATGPTLMTLRSSADAYATDLASGSSIPAMPSTNPVFTDLSFSLTNIAVATTFRLYGYGTGTSAATAAGVAGFDTINGSITPNVILDGTVTAVPEPSTWVGGGLILGLAGWSQRKRLSALRVA